MSFGEEKWVLLGRKGVFMRGKVSFVKENLGLLEEEVFHEGKVVFGRRKVGFVREKGFF